MLTIFIAVIYAAGLSATVLQQANDIDEWDAASEYEGPLRQLLFLMVKAVLFGSLWPVYWSGRALYAVPERLALMPGEPT